ncbi:Lysophospholipase L1 [Caloramator quimbayensis]|uniref:Lysophospholipase L1 n=1 Tax=Caloramator quimbayensis TaxID=1147123 RepID=A0A1T4Y1M5_9CLOT|nr:SGNH/GDSL hydrolase family protein [Caloramator quimbayensis]SKA95717.1 Lysophospholipase L1 [Caloramator quimbayensis]
MDLKETYKFLLCGDSISRGVIFDESKGKYIILKDNYASILETKIKGIIFNAARFGNTLTKGISKAANEIIKSHPDIIVIEFGGNDCDFNWNEVAKNPSINHLPNTDFDTFEKTLTDFIISTKRSNITPILLSLPPIDADRYFKWISENDESKKNNILKWLGSVNKIYWWQERYNSAIIDAAINTNTRWIDIRGAFLKQPDYRNLLCIDGIHPNKEGHRVIADKMLEFTKANYAYLLK